MKFKITYVDPETNDTESIVRDFVDSVDITAREWAEDYAYAIADKGPYTIKEIC